MIFRGERLADTTRESLAGWSDGAALGRECFS